MCCEIWCGGEYKIFCKIYKELNKAQMNLVAVNLFMQMRSSMIANTKLCCCSAVAFETWNFCWEGHIICPFCIYAQNEEIIIHLFAFSFSVVLNHSLADDSESRVLAAARKGEKKASMARKLISRQTNPLQPAALFFFRVLFSIQRNESICSCKKEKPKLLRLEI